MTCFWRSLKGQAGLIFKSASGEAAELCVLEGSVSLFAWSHHLQYEMGIWRAALTTAPVADVGWG